MDIRVHPRVTAKRPEIGDADVRAAFTSALSKVARTTDPVKYVGVGIDERGRLLEFIAVETGPDCWLIYHCAPPSKSILKELGLRR